MTIVRIHNRSSLNVFGPWHCAIDELPTRMTGVIHNVGYYVVGNCIGLDTWHLDINCGLAPGERKVIDLNDTYELNFNPLHGYSPCAASMWWGGIPVTVAGMPLQFIGAVANGAAIDGHWCGRVTPMLVVNLFVSWYPDDIRRAYFKVIITASNPDLPDVVRGAVPYNFRLKFCDATVMVPGLFDNPPLMAEGDWLADGQTRFLSGVLCWTRHTYEGDDPNYLISMCRAIADQQVGINGLKNLHMDGNPVLPAGFNTEAWTDEYLPQVIARQHDWFGSPLDTASDSRSAGAQGGQSFVAGPAMLDPCAVGAIYLGGLDGSWPMFHLERNGDLLDWKVHPGLRLNTGKVNVPISTDKLGKTAWPDLADSHGHAGPEWEHWFDWPAWAAARLTGCPAAQWHLRAHAIQFLFNFVTEAPGNWLPPSRGVGWVLLMAVELYRNLADRELADAVKARVIALADQLILPKFVPTDGFSWLTDPRIGASDTDPRAIPWQSAVLALGCDWAGRCFEHWGLSNAGRHFARQVIERAYVQRGGRWTTRDVIAQDGRELGYEGAYDTFGMPMAPAALLRYEPEHAVARSIWTQLLAECQTWASASWLAPGVPQ